MTDLLIRRTATMYGAGDCARLKLGQEWDDRLPVAAWLLCNSSTADATADDQTARRMRHFSAAAGCGAFNAVNIWPLRTPYPAFLWRLLAGGMFTDDIRAANAAAVQLAAERSDVHFVAFGPGPVRRDRAHVVDTLGIFSADGATPLLCLGTSPEGWPLHPLARGAFAIPNSRQPAPWRMPSEVGP
jgi:hypothetical protein